MDIGAAEELAPYWPTGVEVEVPWATGVTGRFGEAVASEALDGVGETGRGTGRECVGFAPVCRVVGTGRGRCGRLVGRGLGVELGDFGWTGSGPSGRSCGVGIGRLGGCVGTDLTGGWIRLQEFMMQF